MKELYYFEVRLVPNLEDLRKLAEDIGHLITYPSLILLDGDLGAGKTQFTQFFLAAKGAENWAGSPTFSLHNQYMVPDGISVEHVDLYRIKSTDELENTGFWDLFQKINDRIIIVEWANKLKSELWPASWSTCKIYLQQRIATVEITK